MRRRLSSVLAASCPSEVSEMLQVKLVGVLWTHLASQMAVLGLGVAAMVASL